MPQFISPRAGNAATEMISHSILFMALTLAVFALYGAFASLASEYITNTRKPMKRIKRCYAIALAVKLAISEK